MFVMNQQGTQLIKELTLEYVKQNNMMKCNESEIEYQVAEIAKASQKISDAVTKNFRNFPFL